MVFPIVIYLCVGVVVGLLSGLLGLGGGVIVVPILAWLLPLLGIPHNLAMHMAIGTSLTIVIMTSLASIRAHHKKRSVLWSVVGSMLPGIVVGATLGAALAGIVPSAALKMLFSFFLLVISVRLLIRKPHVFAEQVLPGRASLMRAAMLVATMSSMLGIGGGSFYVPYFQRLRLPMQQAVATASACSFPIALTGALMLMLLGLSSNASVAWSTGYIYWPAVFGIVITSINMAPFGVKLAHQLDTIVLRRVFALVLLVMSIDMLVH